jgi:FeS assembly protein IscX
MAMRWNDVTMIAEELSDKYPDIDPKTVRFVDLHNWVCTLDRFDDDPARGGERVLEAIQAAWIAEDDDDDA